MADTDQPIPHDEDELLRRRLLKRVGIAAAIVVALLGGLMLFDSLYVREAPQQSSRLASSGNVAAPAPKAEALPATPGPSEPAPVAEEPAEKSMAAPEAVVTPELSAPPTIAAAPAKLPRQASPQAEVKPAAMRPTSPVAVAVPPPPEPTLASRPIAAAVASAKRFLLQMGVFTSAANAEALRAKLEAAGLPAQIESRVQVGPFANRLEVEQARAKLKAMGLEPGLLMPVHKQGAANENR